MMRRDITELEAQRYTEEFLRRRIATNLEENNPELAESENRVETIENILNTVITIAMHETLNEAVYELHKQKIEKGDEISIANVGNHVNAVYEQFRLCVTAVEKVDEIRKHNIEYEHTWRQLRENIQIASKYEDGWMEVADVWILEGKSLQLDLITGEVIR